MKISTQELLIVLAIVIIIFGPSQLPKLTKMFGKSIKSMKEGMSDPDEADDNTASVKKAEKVSDHDSAEE